MIDNKVEIKGIKYETIEEIIFTKDVNDHSRATIKCVTKEKSLKEIVPNAEALSWVTINIAEEINQDAKKVIFAGIIDTISLENCESIEEIKKLTVNLVGATYLLDIKKETHVFQDDETKLSEIKEYIKDNVKDNFQLASANVKINGDKFDSKKLEGGILVQYLETNYELLKRVASMYNMPLIPEIDDAKEPKICLSIGLGNKVGGEIDSKIYKSEKNMLNAIVDKKLGVKNVAEKDYQMIEVRTREYFELGSKVQIDGKSLYVYSVKSMWGVKSKEDRHNWVELGDNLEYSSCVFYHIYKLAEEKRFNTPQIYNEKMVGTSLDAKVVKVEKEKVKIQCDCNKEASTNPIEFLYASVYTSEDGTGWYCMPEENEKVRLYMPTEDEKDAYVISSVHLEGGKNRDNPNVKFIKNKHDKEVRFEEKRIMITNNDGMKIVLDDDKGISIESTKNVCLSSTKDVTLLSKSGKMDLSGEKHVLLKQGGSSTVEIKNKVTFKAPSIKM